MLKGLIVVLLTILFLTLPVAVAIAVSLESITRACGQVPRL